jgi:AbrB family looped-hinge helix DNA binding protein
MTTKLSSKGQIVLPAQLRRKLALQTGDDLEIHLEQAGEGERIVITRKKMSRPRRKIIKDPITGWPVLEAPPGTPLLTSERVRDMLADFP